jgi:hypothetical protein
MDNYNLDQLKIISGIIAQHHYQIGDDLDKKGVSDAGAYALSRAFDDLARLRKITSILIAHKAIKEDGENEKT